MAPDPRVLAGDAPDPEQADWRNGSPLRCARPRSFFCPRRPLHRASDGTIGRCVEAASAITLAEPDFRTRSGDAGLPVDRRPRSDRRELDRMRPGVWMRLGVELFRR